MDGPRDAGVVEGDAPARARADADAAGEDGVLHERLRKGGAEARRVGRAVVHETPVHREAADVQVQRGEGELAGSPGVAGRGLRRSDHRPLRHRARGARETPAHGPNVDGGGRRWKWQASRRLRLETRPPRTRRSTPRGAKLLSSTVRRARRDISARREEVRRRADGLLSTTRRHKRLSSTDTLTMSPAPSSSSSPPSP